MSGLSSGAVASAAAVTAGIGTGAARGSRSIRARGLVLEVSRKASQPLEARVALSVREKSPARRANLVFYIIYLIGHCLTCPIG